MNNDDNFELAPNGRRIGLMDAQAARLHDGRGNPVGHRPGFVVSDASNRDECEQAHADYERDLVASYKTDARNSRLTRVPDTRDAITMEDILARYVRELCNNT